MVAPRALARTSTSASSMAVEPDRARLDVRKGIDTSASYIDGGAGHVLSAEKNVPVDAGLLPAPHRGRGSLAWAVTFSAVGGGQRVWHVRGNIIVTGIVREKLWLGDSRGLMTK
jgi:hypothetical protein